MPIVETIDLTKKYNKFTAVDRLNLRIEEGEIFGFLGPNGAGKTTTILMLLGLTEPSSGTAHIGGFNSTREPLKVKRITGYVPEHVGFYEDMTAGDNLAYTARLNGMYGEEMQTKTKEALGVVGLADVAEKEVRTFSRGMKQRLAIADILVKEPRVAFLDEPTSGIDPKGVSEMLDLIKKIAHDNKMTVILCSHQLSQVQRICNRVGIIAKGKLVVEGLLEELGKQSLGGGKVMIEVQLQNLTENILKAIKNIEGVVTINRVEDVLLVGCNSDLRTRISKAIADNDGLIMTMKLQSYALEDIYMKYFKEV